MESLFCSAAQVFSNEPNDEATKAFGDVFGLVVQFCMSCAVGSSMRIETTSLGSWHNGTSL